MTDLAVEQFETVVVACHAMATRFEFVLCGNDSGFLRDAGEAAIEDVLDAHARLTRFERTSVVSAINAAAGVAPMRVDNEVYGLLGLCETVREVSGGAFDVTMGRSAIRLDPEAGTVFIEDPSGSIDLGGVGKGFGLDLAASTLREAGVTNALLHGGTSTVLAIGVRPDGESWRVRIGEELDVALRDEAVSVSDRLEGSSARREHIVDPVEGGTRIARAAVVHASAAETDAWSTALVAGSGVCPERSAVLVDGSWSLSEGWNG